MTWENDLITQTVASIAEQPPGVRADIERGAASLRDQFARRRTPVNADTVSGYVWGLAALWEVLGLDTEHGNRLGLLMAAACQLLTETETRPDLAGGAVSGPGSGSGSG